MRYTLPIRPGIPIKDADPRVGDEPPDDEVPKPPITKGISEWAKAHGALLWLLFIVAVIIAIIVWIVWK